MNTFGHAYLTRLHGKCRGGLLLAIFALSLAASMPVLAVSITFTHQSPHSSLPMALAGNQAFQAHGGPPGADVDSTNLIANPSQFDVRPCVAHPSSANCTSLYPAFPPHIDISFANSQGAGQESE